ncbi:MAG: ribonuclease H-like domain-containing protein [Candidatus Zipacnadales bacterium]
MITHSFIHLPRIGYGMERKFWRSGVCTWQDFLERRQPLVGVSSIRWEKLRAEIEASVAALAEGYHPYFSQRLPAREQWRAFEHFRKKAAYLDIETTGLGSWAQITVVGLYNGIRVRTYVRGENLDDLEEDLGQYSLLVTFNGTTFDLPYLRRHFPRVEWNYLHVDLRYVTQRLGYVGGLKTIERRFGLQRPPDIADLNGFDAVRLWEEYRRGNDASLELLIRYNTADVMNLEHLAERAYEALSLQMRREIGDLSLPPLPSSALRLR